MVRRAGRRRVRFGCTRPVGPVAIGPITIGSFAIGPVAIGRTLQLSDASLLKRQLRQGSSSRGNWPRGELTKRLRSGDPGGKWSNRRRRLGRSETPGQYLLDFESPAMRCRFDELIGIHRRQVRRQKANCREMQPAIRHSVEHGRKLARRAGCADPLVGRVLGQPQILDTVGMHRWIASGDVQAPRVDFSDVGQKRCGPDTVPGHQVRQVSEERFVREVVQRVVLRRGSLHGSTCERGCDEVPDGGSGLGGGRDLYHEHRAGRMTKRVP